MVISLKKCKEKLLSLLKKRVVRVGGSVVCAVLLMLLLLPFAVKHGVQWWLVKNGADEAVISALSLNLFTGTLHVKGVGVQGSKKVLFATDSSGLTVDIFSLFRKEVHVEKTYYDHVTIQIKQEENGQWQIASYTTPDQQEIEPSQDSYGLGWVVQVDDVHITNSSVEIITPTVSTVITIDDAQLTNFSTASDAGPADFHFTGKIDTTPIVLDSGKLRVLPDLMVAGQLNITDFDTAKLLPLVPEQLEDIAGLFSVAGGFRFMMDSGATELRYQGDISLANTHLAMMDMEYLAKGTQWQGAVDIQENFSQFTLEGTLLVNDLSFALAKEEFSIQNKGLSFEGKTKVQFLEKGVALTTDSTFISDGIHLEQTGVVYEHSHLQWQGTVGNQEDVQQYLVAGGLNISGLSVKKGDVGLSLTNRDVHFAGTTNIDLSSGFDLKNSGTFTSVGFELLMDEVACNSQKIQWEGRVTSSGQQPHYIINGVLGVDGLNVKMTDADTNISGGNILLAGTTDIDLSSDLKVIHQGSLVSKGFKAMISEIDYGHEQLQWQGDVTHTQSDSVAMTSTSGTLGIEKISYSAAGATPFSLQLENTNWDGTFSYSPVKDDIFASLKLAAQVKANGFAYDLAGNMPLAISLDDIALNDLTVDSEGLRLGTCLLDGLALYSPVAKRMVAELQHTTLTENVVSPTFMVSSRAGSLVGFQLFPNEKKDHHSGELGALTFTDFSWSAESGVALREIIADTLSIDLVRDKNGSLNLGEQIASLRSAGSEAVSEKNVEEVTPAKGIQASPPGFKVDKIELVGESEVLFTDHTLLVPFRSQTVFKKVLIEHLDTLNAKQDTLITVDALLEKRAPFTLSGKVRPFTAGPKDTVAAQLKFKLRNYPLLSLSPYLVQSVGTGLESGQLKLKGSLKLENGEVDVENDLLFKKLVTKAVAPELAEKLDSKLPVPLDTALGLLRDSDDNIALSVPISGPIDKLDFNLTNTFISALSTAVVPAATSYLMYALGPYGALAYVGMKIGENVLEVHLPPVNFIQGEEVLSADHKDYLQRIAKLVKEGKAESDLQVCPVSNVAVDLGREGLLVGQISDEERQQVLELGQFRAKMVQQYLVAEQDVAEDRLLLCITRLEDGSTLSRVELQPEG